MAPQSGTKREDLHVVTGAFGFSGRCIARQLLERGVRVRTLTNHPAGGAEPPPRVEVAPLDFSNPAQLVDDLRGGAVLYNTYWIRFPHGQATHELAVGNTRTLIRCAAEAGVRRFVHVSVTNPSEDSPLSYFRGKAQCERALRESGISYAILRPAVLFGPGDILINNIAWMLRKVPVFGVFGRGDYRLQPVFVEDLAALAIECGGREEDQTLDVVGPNVFTYREFVEVIRAAVVSRARVVHVSPRLGLAIGRVLGWFVGDVLITREEIDGLMAELLISHQPPTCTTSLREWLNEHATGLGVRYAHELKRHFR